MVTSWPHGAGCFHRRKHVTSSKTGIVGHMWDHFVNFFDGVRDGTSVTEDAVFGLRAAAPALACNDSYFGDRIVRWDPEEMRLL